MSLATDDATASLPTEGTTPAPHSIAAFAPAGYEADPARQQRAAAYFAARGDRYVPSLGKVDGRFAASDAERLAELKRVVANPGVDLAVALRGGYGATRLLPAIDFAALAADLRRTGCRLVGHSDFTVLQMGLLKAGAVTFAGPMVGPDFGSPEIDAFMEAHFWRAMVECRVDATFDTDHAALSACGVLWGGNLSMLASLVGTPWMPDVEGGVLFVEDVAERPYRVERMLLQLHQAGLLDRQRLVLCGAFSGYGSLDYDNGYDLDAALAYVRGVTRTPIVAGLPFGHVPRKLTLAVGATIDVQVASGACRIAQRWDGPRA